MTSKHKYEAIVLGASAGGMKVIRELVSALPQNFSLPLIIVQHIADTSDGARIKLLNETSKVHVKEADEKEPVFPGTVYIAPANYHLLIEPDRTFTLTVDERVNYARPSIDVLFETAADAYGAQLVGILCTGSNFDGVKGLLQIKRKGGLTIVQDPQTAEVPIMPQAAIKLSAPDYIRSPEDILKLLLRFGVHQHKSPAK